MSVILAEQKQTQRGVVQRSRRLVAFAFLQALLFLVCTIAGLEFCLTVAGLGDEEYLRFDPLLGHSPMENRKLTWRHEGFSRTSINSAGMHDRERNRTKPANCFRIAVLGDSYSQAMQVPIEENFCHRLEQSLNSGQSGKNFEVLNFGVANFNLVQDLLVLRERAKAFQPDLIIVPYRVGETKKLKPVESPRFSWVRPEVSLSHSGQLLLDYSALHCWSNSLEGRRILATKWLRAHSKIWGITGRIAGDLELWLDSLGKPWEAVLAKGSGRVKQFKQEEQARALADQQEERNAIHTLAPVMKVVLSELKDESDKQGAKMMVVRLPYLFGDPGRESKLVLETTRELDLPYVNLFERVQTAYGHQPQELFFPSGHLTAVGHAYVARELEKFLNRERLLDQRVRIQPVIANRADSGNKR